MISDDARAVEAPVTEPPRRRGSASEHVIRDAVADRLRVLLPEARIIHELVCGQRRADLAAVERERITLVEIKSERDTLDRCDDQMATFLCAGHEAILVAHEKWFDQKPYDNGAARFVWREPGARYGVWAYPEPSVGHPGRWYHWKLAGRGWGRTGLEQPAPRVMLGLLWRSEMADECKRHGIPASPRATMTYMTDMMAYHMTGREIAVAVCRQLRARSFPEADPAIPPCSHGLLVEGSRP